MLCFDYWHPKQLTIIGIYGKLLESCSLRNVFIHYSCIQKMPRSLSGMCQALGNTSPPLPFYVHAVCLVPQFPALQVCFTLFILEMQLRVVLSTQPAWGSVGGWLHRCGPSQGFWLCAFLIGLQGLVLAWGSHFDNHCISDTFFRWRALEAVLRNQCDFIWLLWVVVSDPGSLFALL